MVWNNWVCELFVDIRLVVWGDEFVDIWLETEVWGTLVGCYRYGVAHEIPKNGRKIG